MAAWNPDRRKTLHLEGLGTFDFTPDGFWTLLEFRIPEASHPSRFSLAWAECTQGLAAYLRRARRW